MDLKNLRKIIKRANTRLAYLQDNNLRTPAFKYVEKLKFDDYITTDSKGRFKFPTDLSTQELKGLNFKKLEEKVKGFLETKTSTKIGIERTYKKALDTYNERYGTSLTMSEYSELHDNTAMEDYARRYGSDELNSLIKEKGYSGTLEFATKVYEMNKMREREGMGELSLSEVYNTKRDKVNPFK